MNYKDLRYPRHFHPCVILSFWKGLLSLRTSWRTIMPPGPAKHNIIIHWKRLRYVNLSVWCTLLLSFHLLLGLCCFYPKTAVILTLAKALLSFIDMTPINTCCPDSGSPHLPAGAFKAFHLKAGGCPFRHLAKSWAPWVPMAETLHTKPSCKHGDFCSGIQLCFYTLYERKELCENQWGQGTLAAWQAFTLT